MGNVQTVEQATQIALNFVRKHYAFVFPVSARRQASRWIVDMDISYFSSRYARARILAETGAVEDFKVTYGQLL